jgi:serine/threonine-protein kinase HipA
VGKKSVLILRRFDREKQTRIPFLSAMSMLGAHDNEMRSYLEFVDALRLQGASPSEDMQALWRRIVFNILISNTDDHLRNHGFLYQRGAGWRLAPAYDLNPVPIDIKPRFLSTATDTDNNTASLELALQVADYFGITPKVAKTIVLQVAKVVKQWRQEASHHGITASEIERMSSAFEHEDSQKRI